MRSRCATLPPIQRWKGRCAQSSIHDLDSHPPSYADHRLAPRGFLGVCGSCALTGRSTGRAERRCSFSASGGGGAPVNFDVRPRLRPSHGGSGVASAQPRHYRRRATSCGRPQPQADAHARSSFRRLGLRAAPAAGIVSEASARQRAWPALRPARHQGTQPDGSASRRRRDGQNPSSMAAAEDDEMNPAGPNPAFERTRREATSSSKPRWRRAAQLRR